MSIIARLQALEEAGLVVEHRPTTMAEWGLTPRRLWLVKVWHDWCFADGGCTDRRVSLESLADAEARLNAFVRGRWMENEVDLRHLESPA